MAEGACRALGEGQAQGAGATEGCGHHWRILPTTYEYLLASCPPPGDREGH